MSEQYDPPVRANHWRAIKEAPLLLIVGAIVVGSLAYIAAYWRYDGLIDVKDATIASQQTTVQNLNASLSNLRSENADLRLRLTTAEASIARSQRPRDLDAIFQMGAEVGRVTGAREDRGSSMISFEAIEGNGNFDRAKEFEYRDLTLVVKNQKRATTSYTGRGVQTRLTEVEATITRPPASPQP
jgi:hypothetical protein